MAAPTTVVLPAFTMASSVGGSAALDPVAFAELQLGPAAVALLVGAVALIAVATFIGSSRTPVVSGLAVATVGTQVPLWAAWPWLPSEARSAALATAPLVLAGVVAAAAHSSVRSPGRVLQASYVVTALAVLVHGLGYDPFADPGCARTCEAAPAPLEGLLSTYQAATVSAALVVVAGVLGSVAIVRVRGPRVLAGSALIAAVATVGLTAWAWWTWGDAATSSRLLLLGPVAPGVLGCGICLLAIRTARSRREVAGLVASLSSTVPALRVAYALPGSEIWVDAEGVEVAAETATLVLSDESGPALRMILPVGTDQAELLARLTPATRLALRNSRLSAAANARLIGIHASQRRIIATSDAERRRIERDLHDGAQQRLVSALVQLQLVGPDVVSAGAHELAETAQRLRTVLAHLRHLDLDPFPEALRAEGLASALDDLVAEAAAPVRLEVSITSVPEEIGRAVYAFAVAAIALVGRGSAAEAALHVEERAGSVRVRAELTGTCEGDLPDLDSVADRIGSVGGSVRVARSLSPGALQVEAVIPCGS